LCAIAPQHSGHELSGVLGELGGDVGVGAQGEADLRVAEHLHGDPGCDALLQQQGCGGVPGVVQSRRSHVRFGEQFVPRPVVVARIEGPPVGLSKEESLSCLGLQDGRRREPTRQEVGVELLHVLGL